MQDLTEGPIPGHLARMAIPIAIGMVFQTLYYLVDLYFVAQLGDAAIAGLASAGTLHFLIMALTQILGVGTMALIAHASGRKDRVDANLIFNQSLGLAAVCSALTLVGARGTPLFQRPASREGGGRRTRPPGAEPPQALSCRDAPVRPSFRPRDP